MQPFKEALPPVTRAIDKNMKTGVSLEALRAKEIPAKAFLEKEWVKSAPIEFPDLQVSLIVGGYMDRAITLEDDTVAIIDFKTTLPREETAAMYWRSLAAYQFAVEEPMQGLGREVSELGLYCWNPWDGAYKENHATGQSAITARSVYLPLAIDRDRFHKFTRELAEVAALEFGPLSAPECDWCHAVYEAARFEEDMHKRMLEKLAVPA
jgi:hypothetical protein